MAASKHLGLRDAVAALFSGLAGGRVHENRNYPLDAAVASQIHVYRMRSPAQRTNLSQLAPVDWETEIRVLIKARSEAVADDLSCSCFALLMADQSLGGLCDEMEPLEMAWDQDEADTGVVVVSMDFRLKHRTQNNVIT
jgi:hypothetical protein